MTRLARAVSTDALFRAALSAIDAGDVTTVGRLIAEHPALACDRLEAPGSWLRDQVGGALDGFFQRPYLLWFIAEDPARNGRLPRNIADVARVIIRAAETACPGNLQEQLDYALRLVAWSGVASQCGVQLELIDVLAEAGASLDGAADAALVNGHVAAAARLIERGAPVTLAAALCLRRWDDVTRLGPATNARDRQAAFVLAALNGNAEGLARMIDLGIDLNQPSLDLYSHATPVHHAVCSGSLDAVRVLVEAGAALDTRDTAENATPFEWAEYFRSQKGDADPGRQYAAIAAYLRGKGDGT